VSTAARIMHVPRPSRVSAFLSARLGPPVIDRSAVEEVLHRYGLRLVGPSRNLRLGRRSRNVAVATDAGKKVVKLYRPQWSPDTVRNGHSILVRLEELGFPTPRLVRARDGANWTRIDSDLFAIFDFLPGTNYSLHFLLRDDRLQLTATSGRTLARLHRLLKGFVPEGSHHLGFGSHIGPRRRDLAWHTMKVEELKRRSALLTEEAAAALGARLIARADELLEEIALLERDLTNADFPRLIIHGDYGLHNLIFESPEHAVPIDYELSRLDWRLNDLISALVKYRYTGGRYDFESMQTFVRAYTADFPLSIDERRLLPTAWRFYKLQAAVQYWNSFFETRGPLRKLESALDSIGQAEWALDNPQVIRRLSEAAAPRAPGRSRTRTEDARSRLTVMQVTPDLEIGGAQETVRTVAKYLPRTGCPTVVCTFGDGPLRPELEDLGVVVERLPGRRHSVVALPLFLAEMYRRRRDLVNLITRHGVDVVQTQGLGTLDFLVMTLRFGAAVQVWWTIQNANFIVREEHLSRRKWLLGPKRLAHRCLYRLGTKMVDGVIAVSDETERSFRAEIGGERNRIEVVCNAVDVELYPPKIDRVVVRTRMGFGPADHVMTMVGTFKRQKGHRYLVEAMASLNGRREDLRVVFVGDGELMHEVEAQVEESRLAGRVRFLGSRRDVPELLAASDSFVLPSLWEGLPVALVEAMATGLPVIATSVSGTSQAMVDGATGWLVPPGDAAALAHAILDLLADPARAARMGSAARARVESAFSGRGQAEHLAALFRAEAELGAR
jgi:glycosyltransferase involved in cell wall biosynthesis/Ser/Thr protein kinase RdoA (MazF antagonist)